MRTWLLLSVLSLILIAIGARGDDLQNKYVVKSSCKQELWGPLGNYGMRLDKTQNAYLAAHTVQGQNILMIVRYAREGDECGTIRDVVGSKDVQNRFEFLCVDCSAPSVVVVGTSPEKNNASSATAVQAWKIDLKELKFASVGKKVTCIRPNYTGSDKGYDLVTWGRKGIAKRCSQPGK